LAAFIAIAATKSKAFEFVPMNQNVLPRWLLLGSAALK
jgi:hypothetical protein